MGTLATTAQIEKVSGGLPVIGAITEDGKRCENAQITVYESNQVVNSFKTPRNGSFQLLLMPGKYYTLDVTKDGYVAKRISFDTEMNDKTNSVPVYECDLDLVPQVLFQGMDIGMLDFPMAIVEFDARSRSFTHNEKYTTHMRKTYEQLIIEGYVINSTAME